MIHEPDLTGFFVPFLATFFLYFFLAATFFAFFGLYDESDAEDALAERSSLSEGSWS